MKKFFRTTIHTTAENFETILFSAGKIGYQVELPLSSLQKAIRISVSDIIV
jgi:Cys-tRNA(Pro)/Cys-tRNA(Cys) deacylase